MSVIDDIVLRYIGQPVERVEDLRFLRGAGQYVDDLHRPGMAHAVIVRSPVAHGRLRHLGTAAASRMPGVRAIFTAEHVAEASAGRIPKVPLRLAPIAELTPFEQPVIASDKVRYVGEPLAVVVADTVAQAEDAAD